MSELVPEQSRGTKLAAAVQKLVGVTTISWGSDGKWRHRHKEAEAVEDFWLSSTEKPYSISKGETVYVNKNTYSNSTYKLHGQPHEGKTIPAANVELLQREADSELIETQHPDAPRWSKSSFYVGDVKETYSYMPSSKIIEKGHRAYLISESDGSSYLVQDKDDSNFEGTVEAKSVVIREVVETVLNHEIESIELMCYELLPYAVMRENLITKEVFLTGLRSAKPESGSEYWAGILGEPLASKRDINLTALKTAHFNPGDIIVLCDSRGAGSHTTIASGQLDSDGEPLVYSLSRSPTKNPGCWPIMRVANTFESQPVVKAKAVTPKPPSTMV